MNAAVGRETESGEQRRRRGGAARGFLFVRFRTRAMGHGESRGAIPELLASLEEEAVSWLLARFRPLNAFIAACDSFPGRQMINV